MGAGRHLIISEARDVWSQSRDRARSRTGPPALGNAQESFAPVFLLIAFAPFHNALWPLPDPPMPLHAARQPCPSDIPLIPEDQFTVKALTPGHHFDRMLASACFMLFVS